MVDPLGSSRGNPTGRVGTYFNLSVECGPSRSKSSAAFPFPINVIISRIRLITLNASLYLVEYNRDL